MAGKADTSQILDIRSDRLDGLSETVRSFGPRAADEKDIAQGVVE
jgi:hypothetical protein